MNNQPPADYSPLGPLADINPLYAFLAITLILLLPISSVMYAKARSRRVRMIYAAAHKQNVGPFEVRGILWPTAYATRNGVAKLLLLGEHLHVASLYEREDVEMFQSLASPRNV